MPIGMSLSIFDKDGNLALLLDGEGIKLLLNTYLSFGLDQFGEEILLKLVSSITKGSVLYGLRNDVLTTLAPNTSLTRKYLSQIGDGSSPLATTWEAIGGAGITTLNGQVGISQSFAKVDDSNVTLVISSAADVHTFTMGWNGDLPFSRLTPATAASRLLGRGDSSAGDFQEIIIGSGLVMTGTTLTATAGSGDVTGPASSVNNNVAFFNGTTGKIIKDSGLTLAGSNTGDQTSIVGITGTKAQFDTACTDGNFLYVGDVTQYTDEQAQDAVGTILVDTNSINFTYSDPTPSITADVLVRNTATANTTITASGVGVDVNDDAITNAKLANVATATIKGRVTAATGDPEDLTGTQVTTLLDTFTSALKGVAPASGGGTTNFLRADGTWTAPAGSGQTAVQFRDEGTNLGTSGTVDTLDFVGAGVTATRSTNTVTVTISGGSGITQDQILNLVTFRA